MSSLLAYLTLPAARVQQTIDRLVSRDQVLLDIELRDVGSGGLCAATGGTHDVMRLIGGLASDGEAVLLKVESA